MEQQRPRHRSALYSITQALAERGVTDERGESHRAKVGGRGSVRQGDVSE
ncbi:MAG: hypothetical protein U5K74_13300 [Gemmatimonadaceae bacterium]|nr:hypothetical protein [Gemmatimonadaceae bacterium]